MESIKPTIYLIPRWAGTIHSDWYDWLHTVIKTKYQIEIIRLEMPNWDQPDINESIVYMNEHVKDIDSQTYFIGHSVGCQAVLRFLNQQLKSKKNLHIGGFLFVAGWFTVDNPWSTLKPWMDTSGINLSLIREQTNFRQVVLSDNDPFTANFNLNKSLWESMLNAKTNIYNNRQHFNRLIEEDILAEVEKMIFHSKANK
ncbi:MAG TPA: alpha/beta hydrolase [Paludibacter sp.]